MSITLGIGTRGRFDNLKRTVTETLANITRADTRIVILADLDDAPTIDRLEELPESEHLITCVRPREDSRGEKCARVLTVAPADVYIVGHDCASLLTPGWDQHFQDGFELLPDGIGVINAVMANASFPGIQGPTAKWVEKLGYIYNPEYPFWFIDHELDDIARMTGRTMFVDVLYEHQSRRPGKTLRLRHLDFWTRYFDCMTMERRQKAWDILDAPDFIAPYWHKKILKTQCLMVEARSFNINHNVRMNAEAIERDRGEPGEPDAGYMRLLRAAEDKLINLGFAQRVAA
jgi:hypothetical protein